MRLRLFLLTVLGFLSVWSGNFAAPVHSQAISICNGKACAPDGTPVDLSTLPAQLAATPQYVNGGAFITQDALRANFPCGSIGTLGNYARVLDMYQTVASIAICETDSTTYYWRPIRTDFATTSVQTSGTITLIPFVTSPVVVLSTPPSAGLTITPSTTNVWPGAQFHIYMPGTITLPYTITINGLVGAGTITAVQGRDYILTYTSAGWKSN